MQLYTQDIIQQLSMQLYAYSYININKMVSWYYCCYMYAVTITAITTSQLNQVCKGSYTSIYSFNLQLSQLLVDLATALNYCGYSYFSIITESSQYIYSYSQLVGYLTTKLQLASQLITAFSDSYYKIKFCRSAVCLCMHIKKYTQLASQSDKQLWGLLLYSIYILLKLTVSSLYTLWWYFQNAKQLLYAVALENPEWFQIIFDFLLASQIWQQQ